MIPPLSRAGLLPPGIHDATWAELEAMFGTNAHRKRLLLGLRSFLSDLRDAGARTAYVDGSFVTAKADPGDFDGCWEPTGVRFTKLPPEVLDFTPGRPLQKAKYGGEMFVAEWPASQAGESFLAYFQRDKSGRPKGIVRLDLTAL
jgi:hypothetical protein